MTRTLENMTYTPEGGWQHVAETGHPAGYTWPGIQATATAYFDTRYQPIDADLTAIAALSASSGFLKTNGAGSWTVDTNTYSLSSHDHTGVYQPIDADLTAIAALSASSGFLKTNGAGSWSVDTNTYALSSHNHTGVYEPAIAAGTTAQYWRGDKTWQTLPVGGGAPGGSDTHVQFNNAGAFGGVAALTWNTGSSTLTVGGTISATTLAGTAATGSGASGTWPIGISGTAATATNIAGGVLGSLPYQSSAGATALLAPNTAASVRYLTMTGTGSAGAAPAWSTLPLTLTSNAVGFAVAGGTTSKTLTVSNTLTLTATDGSTLAIGAGGTLGSAAYTAASAYAPATSGSAILKGNGAGGTTAATVRTDYAEPTTALATGILKNTTTTGAHTIAVSGTDYAPGTSALATGLLKSTTTTGALTIAVAGTDYLAPAGALGTPASGTLTNCTGLPIATGVSGLGTGVATALATPTMANLNAACSDGDFAFKGANETISGSWTFSNGVYAFNTAGGTITIDDQAQKRMTWNDGSGNWNFRAGHWFDGANAVRKVSGDGAALIQISSDTTPGVVGLYVAPTDASTTAAITWTTGLTVSTAGIALFGGIAGNAGYFNTTATAPSATTRLNYDGNFYATNFYGNGASLTSLNASNLATGTVPTARLGTGTADATTFLRGDNTWATPPGVGGGTPGGATTQIQYNNAGAFGGDANFTWNATSDLMQIGDQTAVTGGVFAPLSAMLSTDTGSGNNLILRKSAATGGSNLALLKSRGTAAAPTTIVTGDGLGSVSWGAYSGAAGYTYAGGVFLTAEGTVSSGVVPTYMTLLTANAAGTVTERMRLDSAGNVTFSNAISNVATGTQPYACTSTTLNTNLNADMVDGKHVGTSGNAIPLLDGANTWSATQTMGTITPPTTNTYNLGGGSVAYTGVYTRGIYSDSSLNISPLAAASPGGVSLVGGGRVGVGNGGSVSVSGGAGAGGGITGGVRINAPFSGVGGEVVIGGPGVATSDTTGRVWVHAHAGAPSGTPTAPSGTNYVALVGDLTNNKLHYYAAGWKALASESFVTTSYAPLASPALTGTPTAPTAAPGTNTTQIATTAFVAASSAGAAPLASPAFTGTPTAPTAAAGTNTTQIATTAFAQNMTSPAFLGTPTAPTAAQGTATTQLATTAFVRDSNPIFVLNADRDGTNATGNQSVFGVGITVGEGWWEYEIEFELVKTAGTTSHTVSITPFSAGTVAARRYQALVVSKTALTAVSAPTDYMAVNDAAVTATVVTAAITTAAWGVAVRVKGVVSITGVNTATFNPQYALSAIPGGAYTTKAGARAWIKRLGASGANINVGSFA